MKLISTSLGPTITVVSTRSGRVFGGYTPESWAGVDYKAAPRSFLFLLYSGQGKYTPVLFPGAYFIERHFLKEHFLCHNAYIFYYDLNAPL